MHLYSQTTLPSFVSKKDTFALPDRIGPYKVDSLLHQGSMSLLLLGANTRKEPIALKVLLPTLLSDKELCKQFLREAEIISLADHPNIVKLYGQGEWQHGLYIAMEFIQGNKYR